MVAIPGFWLDVDIAGPGHASAALPNEAQAYEIVDMCPLPATIVVHSGRGLHAYWIFEQPWVLAPGETEKANNASKAFQKTIIDAAKVKGWHVDQTGNIDRVLRLPGTKNFKIPGDTRPVEVLVDDGPHHPQAIRSQSAFTADIDDRFLGSIFTGAGSSSSSDTSEAEDQAELERHQEALAQLEQHGQQAAHARSSLRQILCSSRRPRRSSTKSCLDHRIHLPQDSDPVELAEILRPSLDAMAAQSNDPANQRSRSMTP